MFGKGSHPGLILKRRMTEDGYVKVVLQRRRERVTVFVHRLVVETFVRPLEDGEEVDHLNGVKDCNKLDNLEPVSRDENMRRSFERGRNTARGERNGNASITDIEAAMIKRLLSESGATQVAIANEFGVSKHVVSKIAIGIAWAHV